MILMSKYDIYKHKIGKSTKYKCNNIIFDSKSEALHYIYFMNHPHIEIIELQPKFILLEKFEYYCIDKKKMRTMREMVYTPDFRIRVDGIDKDIMVEVKGFGRKDYMIRKKLFISQYRHTYYFIELKGDVKLSDCRRVFDEYR